MGMTDTTARGAGPAERAHHAGGRVTGDISYGEIELEPEGEREAVNTGDDLDDDFDGVAIFGERRHRQPHWQVLIRRSLYQTSCAASRPSACPSAKQNDPSPAVAVRTARLACDGSNSD
jgi:hypothetical protein